MLYRVEESSQRELGGKGALEKSGEGSEKAESGSVAVALGHEHYFSYDASIRK